MDVNLSSNLRNDVIRWVNSKQKNIDQGLELMRSSGYKPHVYQNFLQNKNRSDIPAKLENQLRLFIRYHANPNNPVHQDESHDFYQKNQVDAENMQLLFNETNDLQLYPNEVKDCIVEFRNLYTERSKLHNDLKKSGEGNSKKETDARLLILAKIEACSRRMDELWKAVDDWKAYSYLPSESLIQNKLNLKLVIVPVTEPDEKVHEFNLATDLLSLKKQSEGWRSKIVKAKNRLKYQSDTKKEKLDPMPEGPKKIRLERRLERLINEKLIIDTALAKLS